MAEPELDILGGLIRLHILYHACHKPVFGFGIMEELSGHGYRLSAGTLYPILHGLEKKGYLESEIELAAGRRRRVYTATVKGRTALGLAKTRVWELFRELFEEGLKFRTESNEHRKRKRAVDRQPGKDGKSRR